MTNSGIGWKRLVVLAWLVWMVQPAAAASGPVPDDYKLGAGDLVRISVFNHPDITTEARISESGNLTFPLVGPVAVAGLSTRRAETLLTQKLVDGGFIPNAQVSVLVVDYESQKVSVLGQVQKPGQYALTESSRAMNLIAEAGGLINLMAADEGTVVRADGSSVPIDLTKMFNGDPTQNPTVGKGDTIFIPKAPQFYIYGEVQRPGVYRLEREMTVAQAIAAGGGLTSKASERRIQVRRRDPKTGTEKLTSVRRFDLVKPDDVVYVKQGFF